MPTHYVSRHHAATPIEALKTLLHLLKILCRGQRFGTSPAQF